MSAENKQDKGANMFYHVTFWKKIPDNDASKKDVQTIVAFSGKEGFGITSIKLQPEQQVVYQPEQQFIEEPEAEGVVEQ